MKVNFNGYKENVITFMCYATVTAANVPVKITANGTVGACNAGDPFIGLTTAAPVNGYGAVQTNGTVTVPKTGNITLGFSKLSAAADGKVKQDSTNGKEYTVLCTDENTATFIL